MGSLPAVAYAQPAASGTEAGLLTGIAVGAAVALAAVAWAHWLRVRRDRQARAAADQALRAALATSADLLWRADADGR
ncbi:MAG: hypothetical protein MUC68_09575, partial [Burkholderiaceae bacterium]|nr:hypothetical protein [Burkholderiaceae bacterium]